MTIFTRTWDAAYEAQPADVEDALLGAMRIRHLKNDIAERAEVDHSWAGDAHDGKHNKVTLRVQGGTPALDADDCALYTKANAYGRSKLYLKDEEGADIPLNGGFSTGDCKITTKTAADPGWVLFNDGTIGSATSGGSTRANADCQALFEHLWTVAADAQCPVSGGRGASANADWAANKTLALPKALGRALAVFGTGAGLTARVMAQIVGTETHVLTQAETPLKSHSHGVTDPGHFHSIQLRAQVGTAGALLDGAKNDGSTNTTTDVTGISIQNASDATASGHNNMQPSLFLNVMIKL